MPRLFLPGIALLLIVLSASLISARDVAIQSRDYETLEAYGGSADGVSGGRTDNAAAWDAAVAAGIAHCRPIRLLGGHYYFKRAAVADFSRLTKRDCVPSIEGSGTRVTFLHFARGSDGIRIRGNLTDMVGVEVSNFTLMSGGLGGDDGDQAHDGLTLTNAPHTRLENIHALQWNVAFRFEDMQEFDTANLVAEFNMTGMVVSQHDNVSRPNDIVFVNSKFGNNFVSCADLHNPAAVSFIGGSCEGTRARPQDTTAGEAFGIRFIFDDAVCEGTSAAHVEGMYFESNQGEADVVYQNATCPSTFALVSSSFQRHGHMSHDAPGSQHNAKHAVLIRTGPFAAAIVLMANGFRSYDTYRASRETSYVATEATRPEALKLSLLNNVCVERTTMECF